MVTQIGQIMLYVNNQDDAVEFWTEKAGFHVVAEENDKSGMRWIEISPTSGVETSIVLHDKVFVEKMSPGLHLGTPSIMFVSENLAALHSQLSSKGVTVGEIVDMPLGKVFNFAVNEENYFAVMERMNN